MAMMESWSVWKNEEKNYLVNLKEMLAISPFIRYDKEVIDICIEKLLRKVFDDEGVIS